MLEIFFQSCSLQTFCRTVTISVCAFFFVLFFLPLAAPRGVEVLLDVPGRGGRGRHLHHLLRAVDDGRPAPAVGAALRPPLRLHLHPALAQSSGNRRQVSAGQQWPVQYQGGLRCPLLAAVGSVFFSAPFVCSATRRPSVRTWSCCTRRG